jgi:uncharacterized protein YbbC (DUF1343 family)
MKNIFLFLLTLFTVHLSAQNFSNKIITGAEQSAEYLPLLQGKKVALLVNQTSVIKKAHLVDFLLAPSKDS